MPLLLKLKGVFLYNTYIQKINTLRYLIMMNYEPVEFPADKDDEPDAHIFVDRIENNIGITIEIENEDETFLSMSPEAAINFAKLLEKIAKEM